MRIHGSGYKGQNINQKLYKETFCFQTQDLTKFEHKKISKSKKNVHDLDPDPFFPGRPDPHKN